MIPKPADFKARYPSYKIRAIYQWSDDRFTALQQAVRSSDKQHLNDSEALNKQTIVDWKKFMLQVVTKFPELKEFEDNWPVLNIATYQRRKARNSERKRRKIETIRRHNGHLVPSVFIGNPLPRHIRFQTDKMVDNTTKHPSKVSVRSFKSPFIAQSGPYRRSDRVFRSCTNNSGQITRRPETRRELNMGCVVCLFCNFVPDVPASAKLHIQAFSQNKSIIDTLARLGIVNDKHLFILNLLSSWNAGPEEFLESLAEGILSPLYKVSLLQHFRKYYSSKGPVSPYQDINSWSGCPDHSRGNDDRAPPKLQRLLEAMSMEELLPLFNAAYVTTDDEFALLHDLDEAERIAIFDGDQFRHTRPFQRWMLRFLLAHIDIVD